MLLSQSFLLRLRSCSNRSRPVHNMCLAELVALLKSLSRLMMMMLMLLLVRACSAGLHFSHLSQLFGVV